MVEKSFEPLIAAFCCNWCAYAGADLAGTSRFEYPTNVRIIRVMCTGRVDSTFMLLALRLGADGVLVSGCHPGDCHYLRGNYMMERRLGYVKRIIELLGMEPERLRLEWISAGEGEKFSALIRDLVGTIKKIGPNPLKNGGIEAEYLMRKMDASIEALKSQRLRWVLGISQVGIKIDEARYKAVVDSIMHDEIERYMMILAMKEKGPLTVKEMSQITKLTPTQVMRHIIALRASGMIKEVGEREHQYTYAATV